MPDQTSALIAEARGYAKATAFTSNRIIVTRLADALSAAHTVIEEAKAALNTSDGLHYQRSASALAILSKFPSGEEEQS